jgi:hypothetical protein
MLAVASPPHSLCFISVDIYQVRRLGDHDKASAEHITASGRLRGGKTFAIFRTCASLKSCTTVQDGASVRLFGPSPRYQLHPSHWLGRTTKAVTTTRSPYARA